MQMKDILAIDLGTNYGWACGPQRIEYGGNKLPHDVSDGRALCLFADGLVRLINRRRPDVIAVEQPFINYKRSQPQQVRRWFAYLGILHMVACRFGIPIKEYSPMTIKKHFVGHGHAEKFMIGMECERRGWTPQNDDVADALAVLSCAANMPRSDELHLILKTAGVA